MVNEIDITDGSKNAELVTLIYVTRRCAYLAGDEATTHVLNTARAWRDGDATGVIGAAYALLQELGNVAGTWDQYTALQRAIYAACAEASESAR